MPPDRRDPHAASRAAGRLGTAQASQDPKCPTASDLVDRDFARVEPDRLWVTDITEHPTSEGKGPLRGDARAPSADASWAGLVDSRPTASLAANALGMAAEEGSGVSRCFGDLEMIGAQAAMSGSRFAELIGVHRRTCRHRLAMHRAGDPPKGLWPAPVADRIEPVVAKHLQD